MPLQQDSTNPNRWHESVDVFLNPNVPMQITYYTTTGTLVTTTVIFRDVIDVEGATFFVLANGVLIPIENLVMVHHPDFEDFMESTQINDDEDMSHFQLMN